MCKIVVMNIIVLWWLNVVCDFMLKIEIVD